ncbi:AraC family transcriptional regulator [Silicimonas algicola]|uniref:Helix-turn-helix protein n=1 Tax=Silicimonas algicola TaxID=1826607 RepID=A0A316FZT5_9RHOB|nr:AraC family transcriptional regulator [Silicimonas algicola]AZQ69051.1 AraC family transcriptional regulator [Silicimonas algicola]PWK54058.1 helix-turn-helix protein [Silicimonas algicola]
MPVPRDPRLRKALDLTEARLDQPLRLRELAREVALSERSLARKLMNEIGMNWTEAQRRLRMIRAVELLAETREPVTSIALAVGYGSPSAFGAAFRDFAGQSPSEFRADGSIAWP